MRRTLVLMLTIVASLTLVAAGVADPGERGKGKKENAHAKHAKQAKQAKRANSNRHTFTVTTTDNGSCGTPWATDVIRRTFIVKANHDGTWTLTRRDRGQFTTLAGASPGACDTTGNHGHVIVAGVKGKLVGYLRGTVSGGTYNPNATCTGPECGFTDVFLTTFFGPGAQFSCFSNSADCKFNFNYTAPAKDNPPLLYRHWQDKGKGAGEMLQEEFSGDIAVS
jgi:hypothetical protein